MKAVVMAGGAGSRLRPLTINRPKPMVPMVNKPVIGHILDLLKRHGITDVVITLQYMAEDIQDYLGDGRNLGMNIQYSIEETPLGTAGSVKQAQAWLDDTFMVISGDSITDIDLNAVIEYHKAKHAKATLTLYRVPNPLEYGVIIVNEDGHVQQFLEKPSWGEVISDTVNTGIYVLEPEVLDLMEPGVSFDFSKDLFPILLERNEPMFGYIAEGYWCDVGNLAEYMRATQDILNNKVHADGLGTPRSPGVWCEEGVEIAPDAQVYGPVFLGQGTKIKAGVIIHGPSVIRDYTVIDNNAHIDRSIVWRNCYIGEGVELRGAIIGRQCNLKRKVIVFEGGIVGDSSVIGENAVIHPGVKIWPNKEVEAGATVKTSIIWGAQGRRVLFGRYGVTGLVNVDLTPEFAARLGAAFAATLPIGSNVTINRDPHRSPRMLKRGMISGLPSAGVNVQDTLDVPIPVARYYTRSSQAAGGIHVRLSPYDGRVVDIKFFDSRGQDLSKNAERNIESVFFREDFRRVYLNEIGTIRYAANVVEQYDQAFFKAVDVDAIRNSRPYIALDFANASTSTVLGPILSQLHCRVVALNQAVDESKMSISAEEFQQALVALGKITEVLDTALGVRLDVGGERVFVVDDSGRQVPQITLSAVLAHLAFKSKGGGAIAVPVTLPTIFEQIAAQHNGQVLRTKVNPQALMAAANRKDVVMAADGNGSFIWPDFQPVIDGMMTIAKLLEFLAKQQTTLVKAIAEVPPYFVADGEVNCPWETKGTVMRLLNQQYKDRLGQQIDGIHINIGENQWVLILPDPDSPLFHVYCQAPSQPAAQELVGKYIRIVQGLQQ
ncbi:MAG: NTP transferase domain-containing protein [Chloroflexi bacterium]|nr:NTP transferase domain-containing protein [Chloroflexota bacterium]